MLPLIIIISCLAAVISKIIWDRLAAFKLRDQLGLSGPEFDFFSGSIRHILKQLNKHGREYFPKLRVEWHEQYGKTFGLYIGQRLSIVTKDLDIIKEVMITQFGNFVDRETQTFLDAFPLAESLLQVGRDGWKGQAPGWKDVRSLVSPAFTSGKMKKMHSTIHGQIEVFLECLDAKVGKDAFDIYDDWQALTMDVIARCAFGVAPHSQTDRNDLFYVNCQRFFNEHTVQRSWAMYFSFFFPALGPYLRSISAAGIAERKIADGLAKIIEDRKRNFDAFEGTDLIQLLLQQDKERQINEKKTALSDSVIISNCYAFLLAGYETTSTALAYTSFLLAKHPQVQETLYKEILETFGSDECVDYERVMSLPYLDAVFHESLRLYSPVNTFTSRTCVNETTIKGVHFPRGVIVTVPVNVVHWDEENWPHAKSFIPERFLEKEAKKNLAWMPFGIGPRNCVGLRFAEMEFKTAIAESVRKFRFLLPHGHHEDLKVLISGILLRPSKGVEVRVERR